MQIKNLPKYRYISNMTKIEQLNYTGKLHPHTCCFDVYSQLLHSLPYHNHYIVGKVHTIFRMSTNVTFDWMEWNVNKNNNENKNGMK